MKYITFIIKKMQVQDEKKLIIKSLGKALKKFRKNKSNYLLGLEYGISTSLLNLIERGLKDPQLTTVFKLSKALGVKPSDFIREIEKQIPEHLFEE